MSELENLLEDGEATEATLQRLIGLFGPVAGDVIFELVQRVLSLAPQVSEEEAHASQAGANE